MIKSLGFVMAHVPDVEATTAFYTEVVGLQVEQQAPGFVMFKRPDGAGASFALGQQGEGEPVERWWYVDAVDQLCAGLQAKGVTVLDQLTDMPFGRYFSIKDPSGEKIYFLQLPQSV